MLNSDFANVVTPAAGATEVAQNNLGQGWRTSGRRAYHSRRHGLCRLRCYPERRSGKVIVNPGRWLISGPCGTPTPTATATTSGSLSATPTCIPGGSPGPWTEAAPVAMDHFGGFMDSDGTYGYEGGGYSFTTGDNITEFGRFDPVANSWTPLAPVPDFEQRRGLGRVCT